MPKRRQAKLRTGWQLLGRIRQIDFGSKTTAGAWVVSAVAVIAGGIVGIPRLEAYASSQPRAEPLEIRFTEAPGWVEGDLKTMLLQTARQHLSGDPLARHELVVAREALLATGWFDRIDQVRRVRDDLVEIEGRFATPRAVIRDSRGDHLIDDQGRLLPRTYPVGRAGGLPAITGVVGVRPAEPGRRWEGAEVSAALRLLQQIAGRPWRHQLAAVDVSKHGRDRSIRLITDRGCSIIWGRAPGDEAAGEVPADRKIGYLDYHYEHYGHIDRGFTRDLDIRGDVVIGR